MGPVLPGGFGVPWTLLTQPPLSYLMGLLSRTVSLRVPASFKADTRLRSCLPWLCWKESCLPARTAPEDEMVPFFLDSFSFGAGGRGPALGLPHPSGTEGCPGVEAAQSQRWRMSP